MITKKIAGIAELRIKARNGKDGVDGKTASKEELEALIKPLIPAPLQGERGDKGEKGEQGIQGERGEKGEAGKDGRDGRDGVDGKDADVTPFAIEIREKIQEKTAEHLSYLERKLASKTYNVDEIVGAISFETVSKNLKSYPYTLAYTGDNLTSLVYDIGGGLSVTKTLAYTGDNLTSIQLSGAVPSGISTTKELLYTGDNLVEVVYS